MKKYWSLLTKHVKSSVRWFMFDILAKLYDFNVVKYINESGSSVELRASMWVIVSDGRSQDALPLSFCSEALIKRCESEIKKKWWCSPEGGAN